MTSAIVAPTQYRDPLALTPYRWEVELGRLVIGQGWTLHRKNIVKNKILKDDSRAMENVAGYCVINDCPNASSLERGGNCDKGRASPPFGPLGHVLVTVYESPTRIKKLHLLKSPPSYELAHVSPLFSRSPN